jgi:hypothetical protein
MGGNTLRGDSPPVKSIVLSDEKGVSDDRPRESSPLSLESILPAQMGIHTKMKQEKSVRNGCDGKRERMEGEKGRVEESSDSLLQRLQEESGSEYLNLGAQEENIHN